MTSPLSNKSDMELVSLVKESANDEAFIEICRRYENIFFTVCRKYSTALINSGVSPHDMFEEKNYIILHCISTYKKDKKAKLGTWIGNYARYLCLNSIHSRRFIIPTIEDDLHKSIEDIQVSNNYFVSKYCNEENFTYIINILSQIKDERILEIFQLRYLNRKKMIWTDIAAKVGTSTQTIINLHNKGLDLLRRKIKSQTISDII